MLRLLAIVHRFAAVSHPRILAVEHLFCVPEQNLVMLTMELAGGGEVFDNIVESKLHSELQVQSIVQSLLVGLAVFHGAGMAHGRIDPTALLLGQKLKFETLKIADPMGLRTAVADFCVYQHAAASTENSSTEDRSESGTTPVDEAFATTIPPTPATGLLPVLTRRGIPGFTSPEEYDKENQQPCEPTNTHNANTATSSSCSNNAATGNQPKASNEQGSGTNDNTMLVGTSDMWAVGVLTYIMLSGFQPFTGSTKVCCELALAACPCCLPLLLAPCT